MTKILLVWWYDRSDLFKPFEQLNGCFDFSLLFYKYKNQEQNKLPYPTYYWGDFNSPKSIIDSIKPLKIIFFGVVSHYTIALNDYCKKIGIATAQVEHGVRGSLKESTYLERFIKVDNNSKNGLGLASKLHALSFYLSCISVKSIGISFKYLRLFYLLSRFPRYKSLSSSKFEERRPNKYIVFTDFLSKIYKQRDDAKNSEIIAVGNYYYDEFFTNSEKALSENRKYFLLIDQPIYDSLLNYDIHQRINFYKKLNEFSLIRNTVFKVKLHPSDYNNKALTNIDGIEFVRKADIVKLIRNASGCFGFFSTLLIPAIYHCPTILFDVMELGMVNNWKDIGMIEMFDINKFEVRDLCFPNRNDADKDTYINNYLFKDDGLSFKRLKQAILEI